MDLIKRSFINKVVDDLHILNGTEFEYLCRPLLSIIIDDDVIHKGHNLYAKPVSRTADFSTNNFLVIGQCGTDANYFEIFSKPIEELLKLNLENPKPIKDIYSAIKNSEQCETIYLFANQVASGGKLNGLNKVIKHLTIKKNVEVYDSQLIAELIYDNIPNQKIISELIDYLPTAYQLYLSLSKTNELPALQDDMVERSEEATLISHICSKKLLQIHGISGIGKTRIALNIAHKIRSNFDTVIWINSEANKDLDFKSIKLNEFDKNLNLEYVCSSFTTLLLVDNYSGDAEELACRFDSFRKNDCKLIITSLHKTVADEFSFHLKEMTHADALKMLSKEDVIENELAKRILNKIGGYPLGIKLIIKVLSNENLSNNEIDEFIDELDKLPEEFVPEESKSIAEIVIGRYSEIFKHEFSLISLIDSLTISNFAIKNTLGTRSLRNLTNASLIARDSLLVSSIHSIILMAINSLGSNKRYIKENIHSICEAVEYENENKSVEYYNFCILHNDLLHRLYKDISITDHYRKVILYAIIQTTDNMVSRDSLADEIDKFDLDEEEEINIYLKIEKLELKLISINRKNDEESYQSLANEGIESLKSLLHASLPKNLDLLIRHHIAKITYWKGDQENADRAFSSLLSEYPESQHSRLQLTRILSNQKKHDEVNEQLNIVLGNSAKLVSHSILLSFYDLLSDSNYQNARKKFIDDRIVDFLVDLSSTLHSSFDHPYRVISKLSGYLGYNHPKEFSALCSNLPAPDNMANNPKVMQAYASIQMALYRVYKYSTLDEKSKLMDSAAKIAEKYYLEAGANSDFQKNTLSKFYFEIGNYDKALTTLESVENKEDAFYFQTLSKIQRCKNDFVAAINSIDRAIEIEKNQDNRKWFLSSFLNDKAEALIVKKDPSAISVLKEAVELQDNKKTKDAWLKKMQKWESEINCYRDRDGHR